jgi:uncharacterized protein with FMN-binding domain
MAQAKPKWRHVKFLLLGVALPLLLVAPMVVRQMRSAAQERELVRALVIQNQDLSIHDGTYEGTYTYGGFTYRVAVTISKYTIADIEIISNRKTRHAKMAEGVVERVLAMGNVAVDVVSGATTTSKALLKAIEQALACGS